jgi:hypothetical protein
MGYFGITPFCAPFYVNFRGKKGASSAVGFDFYYSTTNWGTAVFIGTTAGNPALCSNFGEVYFTSGTTLYLRAYRNDTNDSVQFDLNLSTTCPGNNATYCTYDYGSITSNLQIAMTVYIEVGDPLPC